MSSLVPKTYSTSRLVYSCQISFVAVLLLFLWFKLFGIDFLLLVLSYVIMAKWITKSCGFDAKCQNKYLICNSSYVLARSSQSKWIYDKISCKKYWRQFLKPQSNKNWKFGGTALCFWNLCFGFQIIISFKFYGWTFLFFALFLSSEQSQITLNQIAWQYLITCLIFLVWMMPWDNFQRIFSRLIIHWVEKYSQN